MSASPQKFDKSYNRSINQNLLGFIPALVVDNLLEKIKKKEIRKLPEKQTLNSVVMFADISGFTNLSERLSQKGAEGAELLAFALTRYMEFLVKEIGRSGGDIFKFAGDAMIVLWPPPQHNTEEELTTLCRQAIQSGLDIQSKLHEIRLVEDVKLSVKIGFGVGQVTILHVGGVFSRAEYLAAGDPLTEAFECEHLATSGGVVIVSKKTYERVQHYFEFTPVPVDSEHNHKSDNAPFFYVSKVKKDQKVKMKADALLIKNKLKPSDIESIRQSLITYIPAAVMTFLLVDQEKWSHELRRLSVMFCNLGIDLSDAQTAKGLERIQVVIETVQRCVYFYQGSLNKLLMDDKGSTLMIIFGLHPMAHQDDPVRAVFTGLSLVKELKKINCSCSLGITTGVVFAGVVGTSGSRREFSVLGDTVNLSARFMQAACKEKDKKILVDENTKRDAENKISFKFFEFQKVKGKSGDIPFYEPVDFDDEEISKFPFNIRTHMYSPQKGIVDNESFVIYGKEVEEELKKTLNFIEKFTKKSDHNMLILIQGTYGIGKSLFIRVIMERSSKILDNQNWKYNEQTHILVGSLNCSNRGGFLNGWRFILQKVLNIYSIRMKTTPETAIIKILEGTDLLDSYQIMADILGLKLNKKTNTEHDISMKYDEKEQKIVFAISIRLLSTFLEETVETKEKNTKDLPIIAPLFLILENMEDYDTFSWTLIKKVMKKIKKIFIIGAVRTEYCELPPIFAKRNDSPRPKINTTEENKPQDLTLEEIMENGILELEEVIDSSSFYRIELDGFSKEDIGIMIRKKFNYSDFEFEADMEPNPNIIPKAINNGEEIEMKKKSIKKNEPGIEETSLGRPFKKMKTLSKVKKKSEKEKVSMNQSPSYRMLKMMKDKTKGQPLDIIHVVNKLKEGGYIEIKQDKMIVKNKLKKCMEINQFLTLEAPICRVVVNGEILDRLDCESYLLMKSAAVIGECFDLMTLLKVNPFKATIPPERVKKLINYLEKQEFLEILDEQEHNIIYRFMHPFMREVIYQRMIYSQRRQVHRFVAEALQSIPLLNEANERLECDNLIYHWSLAENQDVFQASLSNSSFSFKAKRSVIVKKISSIVSKNPNNLNITLKNGWLLKKSDRGMTWSNRYVVMSCKDLKYYYSENDCKENTDWALGVISLKHIFNIFQLNDTETKKDFAFMIYTGSWQKKNKEMGIREFYFAGKNFEEMEQWITYIEFIRAKAIYDDFVYSFGKISFPLNNALEKLDGCDGTSKEQSSMSRMTLITQAMESSKIIHKNASFLSRKNTSRKMTSMKGLKSMNSMALNSIQDVTSSNLNQELAKKLKERLQRFILLSLMLFNSHIIEVSSKAPKTKFQNLLGSTTTVFRKYPFIVDPSLIDDNRNLINIQKLNSGNLNSYQTLDSIEPSEYGSPKLNRTSIIRSVSGNNEEVGDTSFGSNLSNKKLEEPPSLNPGKNIAFLGNYNNKNNALEMIQEEMEDRNSINDLRKFTDTSNRFQKKLETIRDSIQMINKDPEVGNNLDLKDFQKSNFILNSAKPSTYLTQKDVDSIARMNESSQKSSNKGEEFEKDEKIEQLSTKSEKMPDFPFLEKKSRDKQGSSNFSNEKTNVHENKNKSMKEPNLLEKENAHFYSEITEKPPNFPHLEKSPFEKEKKPYFSDIKSEEKPIFPQEKERLDFPQEKEKPPYPKFQGFMEVSPMEKEVFPEKIMNSKIKSLETQSSSKEIPKVILRGMKTSEFPGNERLSKGNESIMNPQEITNKSNYKAARANKKTNSLDGDNIELKRGENVLITRIYEKKQLGEVLYQGMSGLFDLRDFDLYEKSPVKRQKSPGENVEFDENEDSELNIKKIPKVLQRKQMMDDRNKNVRAKTPIKEEKARLFNEKTIWKKRNDEDTNNWNYGKITFQVKEKE